MKRLMILVTTTLLVIGTTLNAQPGMGQPYGNGPKQGREFSANNMKGGFGHAQMNRLERMKVLLKLSDEQEVEVNNLKFEHDNAVLDIKNAIEKNRLLVRKMMTDNKIDQDKLLSLTSANSELRGKLSTSKIEMWLGVYNLLDDTQKEQWTKMFGKMGQNGRHGKMGAKKGNCMESSQGRMR